MLKKSLFLILFLFLFSFVSKAYAVSPTTTYALSGSLTATNSSGISFFTLSGSTDTITGSNEAIGSITYSGGSFSGSITINSGSGSITLSGSGDTISYNGNSITYNSSTNTFSGSIPLSLTETLTEPATCSDGSTPTSGSCPSGAYLTCPSGYTLSGSTCFETVSGSFTLSGSSSNIDISGGNSSGSISMTQTEECPTGYTLSSGSCVANTNAGATSTFACTDGTNYQNCNSGSLLPSGSAYLCPLGQTQCNKNTSTPQCQSGYSLSGNECKSNTPQGFAGSFSWSDNCTTYTVYGSGNYLDIYSNDCSGGYAGGQIYYNGSSFSGSLCSSAGGQGWCAHDIYGSGGNIYYNGAGSEYGGPVNLNSGHLQWNTSNGNEQVEIYSSGNSLSLWDNWGYGGKISYNSNSYYTTPTCPSGTTLVNGECISYSCPLNGTPQGSAPGQNYTCVEPSGSTNYYCSPNLCYNNTTNTPVSTTETMPPAQTNNGTMTSSGCSGSIYIFPGQALQCTRNYAEGKNCCSRGKFLLGGDNCSSNSQILAKAIIYDNQYSPPVPIYSGSGDMNTAPITSCSASSIATGCGQQGEAIYIGDYCSLKLPLAGTCLAKTYVFCKFQGLLATIIQAQGRAQLAGGENSLSWGSVQSPNCSGFTPAQFQELNFSNMNLSEYIAVIKNQVNKTLTTSAINNQISQTTKSIGNEINQLETGGALNGTIP